MNPFHIFILVMGLLAAVHAICTANFMSKRAPLSVAFETILMFGFAIGVLASCWNGEMNRAGEFLVVTVVTKLVSIIDMMCRGYPIEFSLTSCEIIRHPEKR